MVAPALKPRDGADPGAPLRAAARHGNLKTLSKALAQGAPVDGADREGETALMEAVRTHHVAAAALLIKAGADLDRPNSEGRSARDLARDLNDAQMNAALGITP